MRISDEHRLLFVHVQKTGGVTVENVLDGLVNDLRWFKQDQRHLPLDKILAREPALTKYWIVGFVRNPWARMLSWWSMLQDTKARAERGDERPRRMIARHAFFQQVIEYPDFDTFLERGPAEHKRLRRPQVAFLQTQTRRADFIGRTETLDADLRAVVARLGFPPPESVPRLNPSPTGGNSYRDVYSAAGRDRVAEVFSRDIDAFAYEY